MGERAKRGARGMLRGHPIRYDGNHFRYEDTGEKTVDAPARSCGFCFLWATREGHDACLRTIPGVTNACCGHGEDSEAYITHDDGKRISGMAAMVLFAALGIGPPTEKEDFA